MAVGFTRSFVLNRAVAADKWLTSHLGISLPAADATALERYLETLPDELRARSWDALILWGDDMIRRGVTAENAARALRWEIDLREAEADARPILPRPSKQRRR